MQKPLPTKSSQPAKTPICKIPTHKIITTRSRNPITTRRKKPNHNQIKKPQSRNPQTPHEKPQSQSLCREQETKSKTLSMFLSAQTNVWIFLLLDLVTSTTGESPTRRR